jgi:hypothetical protein
MHIEPELHPLLRTREEELVKTMQATRKKIESANKTIAAKERLIRELNDQHLTCSKGQQLIREFLFLNECIPEDIFSLRRHIQLLEEEGAREDITVARQKEILQQIQDQRAKLRKNCLHPLVLYSEGYSGSSGYDYDDARSGEHACIICGLTKYDRDYKGNNDLFPHDSSRIARRLHDDNFYQRTNAQKMTLHERRDHYLRLTDIKDLLIQFFGPRRLQRLRSVLEPAQQ